MQLLTTLLFKILPLYLIIFVGYIAAQKLHINKESISKLLIYLIAPVIIFYGTLTANITLATLSLPVLFFIICSSISLIFYAIGRVAYKNTSEKNILSFAAGTGNTGYFGLPVVAAILGENAFSLAVLIILGVIFYESTLGFYVVARGNYSAKKSLMKVLKLPAVYAFFTGVICNLAGLKLGENLVNLTSYFKGTYTLLGMMLIGMGLSNISLQSFDLKLISLSFAAKFIAYPLVIIGVITLDKIYFNIYSTEIHNVLLILSIVPLAANAVAFATELKVHPEKVAIAVLLSTILALFLIPFTLSFIFNF